jgi:cytochrome c-type biogenesis protein
MFVLGFSIVFIISGLSFGFIGSIIGPVAGDFLRIMGGLLIISFGLFMMGLLKFSFFEKEIRIKIPKWLHVGSLTSSFLLGSAFAIGWTPCIGPVYGTILIYAGSTNTAFAGAALLATFSLGFSVPLVLLALMFGHTAHFIEKISPYLRIVSVLGGFVLVMLGITFLFGNTGVTNWFFEMFENVDLNKMLMPYL